MFCGLKIRAITDQSFNTATINGLSDYENLRLYLAGSPESISEQAAILAAS